MILALLASLLCRCSLAAGPEAALEPQRLIVTGRDYRVTFQRDRCDLELELRDASGQWRNVTRKVTVPEFAVIGAGGLPPKSTAGGPARVRHEKAGDVVAVGLTTVLPTSPPIIAKVHFLCTDEGMLISLDPEVRSGEEIASYWPLPRLTLDQDVFDAYAYWRAPDELRAGRIAGLGTPTVYAGVSPWGNQGDTAPRLSPRHPAIIARSESAGLALGAVLLDYPTRWASSHSFLQWYKPAWLHFYPAVGGEKGDRPHLPERPEGCFAQMGPVPLFPLRWAWLAPMPVDPAAAAARVEHLLEIGKTLTARFRPIAPDPESYWTQKQPDFPAALRRVQPVEDVRQAVVYTINETILSDDGIDLARKAGSDVLIRGWFKWETAPDFAKLAPLIPKAHQMGALFGGGITCSALYHDENGLSEEQVLDMATRGPEGQLVDAWNEPRCRHGTLSNPAYLEYLLSWCTRQIDAGADYLFMDEINAALASDEGFDDYSIADFRRYLLERYGRQGWAPDDARWHEAFKIDLSDRSVAPGGTMDTFQYRAYLKSLGLASDPRAASSSKNPLAAEWHAFRDERDDRAWKRLTDAIRAHAASRGRRVLVSANGLARYVDLQVLGVWDRWVTKDGRIDLSESQIEQWGSTVAAGWGLAGKRVPVVFFHDWGFGGFPWLEVPPEDRWLWIRIRGAEIYAAGGFFAFPVHGPFGNDSRQDGTLPEIARQSEFYHRHKDLYLGAELLGFDLPESDEPQLSLALWRRRSPPSLILHVINRQADVSTGKPVRRMSVAVSLPTDREPKSVSVVSPDWQGGFVKKPTQAAASGNRLVVTLPELEAYDVAVLEYDHLPEMKPTGRRIVPSWQWVRPARNEFVVHEGGLVADQWALPGMLQGNLHQHLRNPPTFVVNMPQGGSLEVHVRGVATLGARLEWRVDGRVETTIDLPDRDKKNESTAREYDQTYELPIPPGRHRLTLDNVGGDWASIGWYAFAGQTAEP